MAQDQGVILWPREVQPVTMSSRQESVGPGNKILEGKMGELGREAPVMIASYGNQLCIGGESIKNLLDPGTFWGAGPGSMDDIAQKHKSSRLELIPGSKQLLARTTICQGPEFAPAPLSPAVPEMKVRNDRRSGFRNPKSSGRVSVELRGNRHELS
jgi:hypothetical protein